MKLNISDKLTLPPEAVTQTFAILAKRGVGKTYTAAVMTEEMLKAKLQVVVIDPVGVWWGLRAGVDNKDKDGGFPIVVMGGDHGDVPLEATGGELVADFVVESGRSVVLDLSAFRKGEMIRFMTAFTETIYRRNRAPLHLVVDEADAFAPQKTMHGEGAERLLGAMEDIVRRGRARGLGCTLITQRAAVLNKNVLTQIEVLVALRTIAPQDRDAVDAWINVHGTIEQRKTLMESLPSLPIGEAWFWSPGWLDLFQRVKVRRRETFDSSATPKAGEKIAGPKKLKPVDLDELRTKMAATIEKAKAEDPRELQRQIANLQRTNAELQRKAGDAKPGRVDTNEVPVLKDGQLARAEKLCESLADLRARQQVIADDLLNKLTLSFSEISKAIANVQNANMHRSLHTRIPVARSSDFPASPAQSPPAASRDHVGAAHSSAGVSGGMQRMMIALAQRPGLSARQIGVRAGLSSSSGTFGTYLGKLRSNGWAEGTRERLELTKEGLAALGSYTPLPTGQGLLQHWLSELGQGSGAGRMLKAAAEVYPRTLSKEELGKLADISHTSGTFGTYLGKLRSLELIAGSKEISASAEFFE